MRRALLSLLMLSFLVAPARADVRDGIAAYHRGEHATAQREFRPLAEGGDACAQMVLGIMHMFGEGSPRDPVKALGWFRKAAATGDMAAQQLLALFLELGLDGMKGVGEAERWYQAVASAARRAADKGDRDGQWYLGSLYATGTGGLPRDETEAVRLFREASEQGHARAQHDLATMYDNGQGVPEDEAMAARWYLEAARQGYARAQLEVGLAYKNGEGVLQDAGKAMAWLRRAAKQGNAAAQNELGAMLEQGLGTAPDTDKAAAWYRRAAQRGNAHAQANLGRMYIGGSEVGKDWVAAHMWLSLAAARDPLGITAAARARDVLELKMTREEILRARRMASTWKPSLTGRSLLFSLSPPCPRLLK